MADPRATPFAISMTEQAAASDHPNLVAERAAQPFPQTAMRHYLDGSPRNSALRDEIMGELDELHRLEKAGEPVDLGEDVVLESTPISILPNEDHTVEESRLQTMKMIRFQYSRLTHDEDNSAAKRRARMELMSLFDPAWFTRQGVHFGLWLGAVQGQGDRAQVAEWMVPTMMMRLSGCFAMTEIGHGSFVRGIETTATYDPVTETFDVHTPRIESTKWWIGGAAKTATHAAVFAQLVLPGGARPGVHTFVVPLRSLDDHRLLPGIRAGDCGAKFGRDGLDNGWIQFNHVQIPRAAMLCKYATVEPSGAYTQRGSKQLQYGALIGGRAIMVTDSAVWLKAAVTIAVRYLALRRQGDPIAPGGREPQLIDFRTVQTRVMPLVATAYALNFTALFMQRVAPQAGLTDGDEDDGLTDDERAAMLPDLHATCAGLKAYATWATYYGIDTLRQCLGGHGYSGYTGLGRMFTDFAVQCTWEGDNTVMALQTARYLVASYERLDTGEPLGGSVAYLESLPRINKAKRVWPVQSATMLRSGSLRNLLDAFRYLLAKKVERVALRYRAEKKQVARAHRQAKKDRKRKQGKRGPPINPASADADRDAAEKQAWNNMTPELLECSRGHCYFVISENFVNAVERAGLSTNPDERCLFPALDLFCRLFVLQSLSEWLDWFLAMEYMAKKQMFLVKDGVTALCEEAREIAVPAVDAFGLSDLILRSPLGRRDGHVYDLYFDRVLQKPGAEERASYYDSQIKPLLQSSL